MHKYKWLPVMLFSCFLLSACTSSIETYHPGWYQEGHYHDGGYRPAYYDVYGNFHATEPVAGYYQYGRWHRAYITTTKTRYRLSNTGKGALIGAVAGGAGGAVLGGNPATVGVASVAGGVTGGVIGSRYE